MADRAEVPSNPLVTIAVDDRGRIAINGHDVPHDGTDDPRRMATDIVSADFAQPLGRPVRAIATLPGEELLMVIHPDGRVSDIEPHRPATPAGVPPATRAAPAWVAGDANPVAAEIAAARHAGRRRRYPLVVGGAVVIAAAAALVVVWDQRAPLDHDDDPATATADLTPTIAAASVAPVQPVLESTPIRPFAVSDISAKATPEGLNLTVAARRRTPARVVVVPLEGSTGAQRLTVTIRSATDRLVTVPGLEPGRYRWKVVVPGQPRQTGVVEVPEPPEETVTVPITEDVAPEPDQGGDPRPGRDDGDDVRQPVGVSNGPNHPVDPDGD
jgi:hypothetical protein